MEYEAFGFYVNHNPISESNDAILKEASKLGYTKVYLKTDLVNYYEKFGAKYLEDLNNGERLYYFDLKK